MSKLKKTRLREIAFVCGAFYGLLVNVRMHTLHSGISVPFAD